jgi:hypothetical protein
MKQISRILMEIMELFNGGIILLRRVIDLHSCPIVVSGSAIIASSGSEGSLLKLEFKGILLWEFRAETQIYN